MMQQKEKKKQAEKTSFYLKERGFQFNFGNSHFFLQNYHEVGKIVLKLSNDETILIADMIKRD